MSRRTLRGGGGSTGTPLASGVAVTPSGSVSATNVQGALLEIASDYAAADSAARLATAYGSTSGIPNSPASGVTPGPGQALGPNLWLSPTSGSGLSTVASPTITANSTNQSVKTRLDIGYINSGTAIGQATNIGVRLVWDLTSTITTGWGYYLTYQWVDSGGTLVSGTTAQTIAASGGAAQTNYKGVLDIKSPATGGPVFLDVILNVANNSSAGTVTLNSMDVRRVGRVRSPLAVGWTGGTPNTSAGQFSVFVPIVDPSTDLTSWAETQIANDSVLEAAISEGYFWTNAGGGTFQFSPIDGTGNNAQQTPTLNRTTTRNTSGTPRLHIKNNSQIMGIINGSGAQELRCNTHGGETGRSGTYTTDFLFEYDLGDGTWRTCPSTLNLAQFCRRFRLTQHTKVVATTGETVANVDYIWTFFDDGTIRQDRTVTFQRTQAMYAWFVWMTSFDPTLFIAQGKIGSGQNVLAQVDYRAKLSAPTISSVTTSTSGGVLPAAAKTYRLTRRTIYGETTPSAGVAVTSTGSTSSNTINFPASSTGQTSWGVYDANGLLGYVPAAVTSYVDTGAAGAGAQPPTVNTAWDGTGANGDAQGTLADWCVYKEATTGVCFSKVINRDDILTQHPSAVAVRSQLTRIAGSVCKNYVHVEATGGGALTGGAQAAGFYPVTITNGTVVTNTSYDFIYLPLDASRYEYEQTARAANVSALATVYPAA